MGNEMTGIVESLQAKRRIVVRGMSQTAKHAAFPTLYARPIAGPDPFVDQKEIARLRRENTALQAKVSGLEARNEVLQAKLAAQAMYANRKITIACGLPEEAANRIAGCVARHFGVELTNLQDVGRIRQFVRPRQACYRLFVELLNLSMPNIGRYFRRDHTTVMHGLHSAQRLFDNDIDWRSRYDAARAELIEEEKSAGEP